MAPVTPATWLAAGALLEASAALLSLIYGYRRLAAWWLAILAVDLVALSVAARVGGIV